MVNRLILTGLALAVLGFFLLIHALRSRWARGFISGKTVTLDNVTLFSKKHLLVGRPDRIVKQGKAAHPGGVEVLERPWGTIHSHSSRLRVQ